MLRDMPPILLASASPRRHELLALLELTFSVIAAGIDETNSQGETPPAMVQRLSREKALHVALRHPQALVIAADTTVALDGGTLGKPADTAAAAAMLRRLRGRPHQVYSGLTVAWGEHTITEVIKSVVWMRDYSDEELIEYAAGGDPLDKAGGYAVQNRGFHPAERIEGCRANIMGLPLCHLARTLVRLGVKVPANVPVACQAHNKFVCQVFGGILDLEENQ